LGEKQVPPLRYGMTRKKGWVWGLGCWLGEKQVPPLRYGMTRKKGWVWGWGLGVGRRSRFPAGREQRL
jgi:hypothetical protein